MVVHAYAVRIGDSVDDGDQMYWVSDWWRDVPRSTRDPTTGWKEDLRYRRNQDRHPSVSTQWSNGVNQADELNRLMTVCPGSTGWASRRFAGKRTGPWKSGSLISGYHRYAVEGDSVERPRQDSLCAATGARRCDGSSAVNQRKALDALAATLKPSELTVPRAILSRCRRRRPGFGIHRELFRGIPCRCRSAEPGDDRSRREDWLRAQGTLPRMVAQNAPHPVPWGLDERSTVGEGSTRRPRLPMKRRCAGRESVRLVDRLTWLASSVLNGQVRAVASLKLQNLAARLRAPAEDSLEADRAAHTARRRHQAIPGRPSADPENRARGAGAARRADRRCAGWSAGLAVLTSWLGSGSGYSDCVPESGSGDREARAGMHRRSEADRGDASACSTSARRQRSSSSSSSSSSSWPWP